MAYNSNGLYDDAIRLSENSLQTEPTNQHMLWVGGTAYAEWVKSICATADGGREAAMSSGGHMNDRYPISRLEAVTP
jgi:hypothetical protein